MKLIKLTTNLGARLHVNVEAIESFVSAPPEKNFRTVVQTTCATFEVLDTCEDVERMIKGKE